MKNLAKLFLIGSLFIAGCGGLPQPTVVSKPVLIKDPVPAIDNTAKVIEQATKNINDSVKVIEEQTRAIDAKTPLVKDNTDIIRQMDAKITAQTATIADQGTQLAQIKSEVETLKTTIQGEAQRTEAAVKAAITPLNVNIANLTKANAKLEKQASANMESTYALMGILAFLGVLTIAAGTYIVVASPVSKLKGSGLIAAGVMGVVCSICVITQSLLLGIIGASVVGLIALSILIMYIREQMQIHTELVSTTQVTKNALTKVDPAAAQAIFNPPQTMATIQSPNTTAVVAAIKANTA